MSNGLMLSLTFIKAQEIAGWARHDTQGSYESIATVQEGDLNAVYYCVVRNGNRWIERQATQLLFQASDAWQLDAALSIHSNYPAATLTVQTTGVGTGVAASTSPGVFAAGDVGKVINAVASRAVITSYVSPTEVVITTTQAWGDNTVPAGLWRMDPVRSTIGGLGDYNGMTVYALVDGVVQGPFTVSGSSITLTTPGSQVLVGLKYTAQLQPLYLETPGPDTGQGKQKKVSAASVRVRNTKGLRYGPSFNQLLPWTEGVSSTDPPVTMPYSAVGLYSGDQRLWLDQMFGIGGWVCIQQDQPYPATVLSIYPELAQGDAM